MLEDLDTIDLVMQGEPGEVIIKIIDGGVTTDAAEFNTLLKAKIGQAINALADEGNFEGADRIGSASRSCTTSPGRPSRTARPTRSTRPPRCRGRSRSPWCSSRASRATQCPSSGGPAEKSGTGGDWVIRPFKLRSRRYQSAGRPHCATKSAPVPRFLPKFSPA